MSILFNRLFIEKTEVVYATFYLAFSTNGFETLMFMNLQRYFFLFNDCKCNLSECDFIRWWIMFCTFTKSDDKWDNCLESWWISMHFIHDAIIYVMSYLCYLPSRWILWIEFEFECVNWYKHLGRVLNSSAYCKEAKEMSFKKHWWHPSNYTMM